MKSIPQSEIPQPENIGSDGKQVAKSARIEELGENPLGTLPLVREIEGIAGRGKGFGNDVANGVVVGTLRMLDGQNRQLTNDLHECQQRLDKRTNELAEAKTREAILEERLRGYISTRKLVNFATVIGSLVFSFGVERLLSGDLGSGTSGVALGLILVLLAWLVGPKGEES